MNNFTHSNRLGALISYCVWLPTIALVFFAGWLAVGEAKSSVNVASKLLQTSADGSSEANAIVAKMFEASTHKEGTKLWKEISELTNGAGFFSDMSQLPIVGTAEETRELPSVDNWNDQAVDAYLTEVQPILKLIAEARQYPRPVWHSLEFNGYGTLLKPIQDARSIARIARLEVEDALVHKDAERALRGLEAMEIVAEAYDWDTFLVSQLVHVALVGMTYDAIERSLQTDVWDAEQMRGICDKLAIPNDVEQHWRASLEAEKLMGLAALQSNQLGNGPVADGATQNSLLLMYEQAVEISPQPLSSFVQRVGDFENEIVENSFSPIISQVMPALASYAQAWVTFEDSRKFLRLACAIKLYQLQEGKWPTKFSELEAVGLSADDWDLAGSELADIKVAEGVVSIEAISERAAATYFPLPNVGQSDSQVSRITIR